MTKTVEWYEVFQAQFGTDISGIVPAYEYVFDKEFEGKEQITPDELFKAIEVLKAQQSEGEWKYSPPGASDIALTVKRNRIRVQARLRNKTPSGGDYVRLNIECLKKTFGTKDSPKHDMTPEERDMKIYNMVIDYKGISHLDIFKVFDWAKEEYGFDCEKVQNGVRDAVMKKMTEKNPLKSMLNKNAD